MLSTQSSAKKLKLMEMEGDNRYVLEDMIIEILKRLPVKTLIRFQLIRKSWKNLIKSPCFIHEHLRYSSHRNPYVVFEGIDFYNPLRLHKPDQDMEFDQVQIPYGFRFLPLCASYIDSSNGLLCIRHDGSTPIVILWNPAIRELRRVKFRLECESFKMGFGFSDCKVDDCRVVFISDFTKDTLLVHRVDVYSLSTSLCEEVQSGNLLDDVAITSNGKTINGSIFWFGVKLNVHLLVSYDIAKEMFTLIPLPISPDKNDLPRCSVAVHENELALLSHTTIGGTESWIRLWVMEVGGRGWIEKHSIKRPFLMRPATIWKNEIVCESLPAPKKVGFGAKIVLANLTTDANREFVVDKYGSGFGILNYVPSLVPVSNKINASTDEERIEMLLKQYN